MEKYKLVLQRKAHLAAGAVKISVVINDTFETKMSMGTSSVFELDYKPTKIRFYIKQFGRYTVDQTIMVDPKGYNEVTVRYNMTMRSAFKWQAFTMQTQCDAISYEILYGALREDNTAPMAEVPVNEPPAATVGEMTTNAFCMYCGSPLPQGAVFCPKCGKKVG